MQQHGVGNSGGNGQTGFAFYDLLIQRQRGFGQMTTNLFINLERKPYLLAQTKSKTSLSIVACQVEFLGVGKPLFNQTGFFDTSQGQDAFVVVPLETAYQVKPGFL